MPLLQQVDALQLVLEALPLLRGGLTAKSARRTTELLQRRLQLDAAAVVDTEVVLAFQGIGSDHHLPGTPIATSLTRRALTEGRVLAAAGPEAIGCARPDCPLGAAMVLPLQVRGQVVGALKLYRRRRRHLGRARARAAEAVARLFSVYLELAELDVQAARVTQAELEALRAQISPHFLFNTLNTIAALTYADAARAHDLIVRFAEFFRDTLNHRGEFATLEDELAYVNAYLEFERARLGDRLRVDVDVAPECRRALLPVLVVQPLVENAINHGIEPRPGPGSVRIAARAEAEGYRIVVSDTGIGIPPERLGRVLERGYGTGLGMGLANVDQRLKSLFGLSSGLRIQSAVGEGTDVSFWVPARR
ncbi:sensor histidine kinase [Limnochorda pilosa]|uniref:histidine kinase n=1 Tax=Limnochorda pilosa TaxID=1555112 RepID=A0A0K2SQ62_LIMPI|nr:histidine kinase [Limnochorda pilosa]BAS29231.1 histidine kinase [Limnochorda pilosa]